VFKGSSTNLDYCDFIRDTDYSENKAIAHIARALSRVPPVLSFINLSTFKDLSKTNVHTLHCGCKSTSVNNYYHRVVTRHMLLANVVTVTENTKDTQYYQLLVYRPSIIKSPNMAFINTVCG